MNARRIAIGASGEDRALTGRIIAVFLQVYNELGYGFLESVYASALSIALREGGHRVDRQTAITVYYRGRVVGVFRADMIVDNTVVIELKAGVALAQGAEAQLMNYLRACSLEVGLLLHFGQKPVIRRVVYENERKLLAPEPEELNAEKAERAERGETE